jgi:hypothetical protein
LYWSQIATAVLLRGQKASKSGVESVRADTLFLECKKEKNEKEREFEPSNPPMPFPNMYVCLVDVCNMQHGDPKIVDSSIG